MRDMYSRYKAVQSLEPLIRTTGTANGATVDLRGYEGALIIASVGQTAETLAAGTDIEFRVQESSDDSTWTAVADADLIHYVAGRLAVAGTFALIDSNSEDVAVYQTAYRGTKRYIRIVAVTTNCATGTSSAGVVVLDVAARNYPSAI